MRDDAHISFSGTAWPINAKFEVASLGRGNINIVKWSWSNNQKKKELTFIFYLLSLQLVLCCVAVLKSSPVHRP